MDVDLILCVLMVSPVKTGKISCGYLPLLPRSRRSTKPRSALQGLGRMPLRIEANRSRRKKQILTKLRFVATAIQTDPKGPMVQLT